MLQKPHAIHEVPSHYLAIIFWSTIMGMKSQGPCLSKKQVLSQLLGINLHTLLQGLTKEEKMQAISCRCKN